MSIVRMKLANGEVKVIEINAEETLMRAAVRQSVPGIEGECGGEMSCGTCHVYIHSPWKERLRGASDDEMDLLAADDNSTEDSRLSCQIKMTSDLDGLELTVVEAE